MTVFISIGLTDIDWTSDYEGESLNLPNPGIRCMYCGIDITDYCYAPCNREEFVRRVYANLIDGRIAPGQ